MTIKVNNTRPFWIDNINFPSPTLFNKYVANCTTINANVNFESDRTITTTLKTPFPFIQLTYQNQTLNFIFVKVVRIVANGYVCVYNLDIYSTYILKLLNNSNNFFLLRNPILDNKTLLFNDPLFDNLKYTGDYQFVKNSFLKMNSIAPLNLPGWLYNNIYGLCYNNTNDALNGVVYAVFASGESGKYDYFPIVSKSNNSYWIETTSNQSTNYKYTMLPKPGGIAQFTIYDSNNQTLTSQQLITRIGNNQYSVTYKNKVLFTTTNIALLNSLNYNYTVKTNPGSSGSQGRPVTLYTITVTWTGGSYSYQSRTAPNSTFNVDVYTTTNKKSTLIANSYDTIAQLKFSQEYSNKFLGLYFLPHIFYMSQFAKTKTITYHTVSLSGTSASATTNTFLTLDLQPEGVTIPEHSLIDLTLSNNPIPSFNNENLDNYYLLKYSKAKRYNNELDLSLFFKNQQFLSEGYFNYSGAGNYVDKILGLPLSACTWTYPYQLPSGTDSYRNYINANYNSYNTGIAIAKQNIGMGVMTSLWQSLASSLTGYFGGVKNAGAIGGVNAGTGVFKSANHILAGVQSLNRMKAQYADARNTYGTEISNSMIRDSGWLFYYSDNDQYDGLEMFVGDSDFNLQMNNIIYLYSYYSPRYTSLSFITSNFTNWDCYFIQFEENDLRNKIYKLFTTLPLSVDIINDIGETLINGLRIWNKDPDSLTW